MTPGDLSPELREFAETPSLFTVFGADEVVKRYLDDRVCIIYGPTFGVVSAPRVGEGEVAQLLDDVRELLGGDRHVAWYIGPSARPPGIVDELRRLGVGEPLDGARLVHVLATDSPPEAAPAEIETRETGTFEEYAAAAELRFDAFDRPEEERERDREHMREFYESMLRMRGIGAVSFIAMLEGRLAGSATAVLSPRGVFLIGGATASWARGRGVYRALVRARWDYAVERGTPALAVHADPRTSSPILGRLGFRHVCDAERLEGV
ncbi:MAG TPA: GNAT family N-acetyltransferase [Gaiellaceae bacterium]